MKKLQVFLMILFLGIFILPKQMISAQQTEMSCCKKESKKEDCCKDHHQKSGNKHQSCDDGCCATCNTCTFVYNPVLNKDEIFVLSKKILERSSIFSYQEPFISSSLKKFGNRPRLVNKSVFQF